jgi:hypothetical protein
MECAARSTPAPSTTARPSRNPSASTASASRRSTRSRRSSRSRPARRPDQGDRVHRGEVVEEKKPRADRRANGTRIAFDARRFFGKAQVPRPSSSRRCAATTPTSTPGSRSSSTASRFRSKNGCSTCCARNGRRAAVPRSSTSRARTSRSPSPTARHGEEYYSFVNGQHTTQGGTHLAAFREAIVQDPARLLQEELRRRRHPRRHRSPPSRCGEEPVFESQTKTKLGSATSARGPRCAPSSATSSAAPRQLPAQAPAGRRGAPEAHPGLRARAQGTHRHPQARPRARQARPSSTTRSCATAASTSTPSTSAPRTAPLHHRGRQRQRLDHQEPRRADPGRLLAARQAAQHLRPDPQGGLRERGVRLLQARSASRTASRACATTGS